MNQYITSQLEDPPVEASSRLSIPQCEKHLKIKTAPHNWKPHGSRVVVGKNLELTDRVGGFSFKQIKTMIIQRNCEMVAAGR
jgi:hypothetical protein